MDIVVLDLEWDSVYSKKHHRFVNQIIQIGAVRLDEKLNIVDTFEVVIKSAISKKLTKRFVELTGITAEIMADGVSVSEAISKYNKFAPKDYLMMTWSTSDLYTLIDNTKFVFPKGVKLRYGKYMDLQSFVQNKMRELGFEIKSQISLLHAAQMLKISADGLDLHTAKDDSLLSVALLKRFYTKDSVIPYIKDTTKPEFFERLTFKSYTLTNIHDDLIKPEDLIFNCENCKKTAKCLTGWKYRNGWFSANFRCVNCKKMFIGRVSFKKTYDNLIVKKRVIDAKPVEKGKNETDKLQSVSKEM